MKKLCSFLLALLLLTTTAGAVDLYVDTTKVETDTPPTVVDGRTLVPVRAIFESIGATVTWDAATSTATGIRGDVIVSIQIDNTTAYVNGEPRTLDVPAQLINNRTMVPARFISESMGCDVTWHQETETVGVADKTKGQHIYVTKSGQKYHYNGTCNGGTYYEATLAEAMGRGLTPCDKCVLLAGSSPTSDAMTTGNYKTTVLRVVDGDTIVVNYNGAEEKVRLIGVDTPESVHPDNNRNTDAGFAASEFTNVYLTGQDVELEFDVQQRDQYGRLLAYVYLDGEMFNMKLLQTGYANLATYPPNVKYLDQFTEIIKNRDPSIPSGEYDDGYMKAPKLIYNTDGEVNGLKDAFLYDDGTITEISTFAGYNCLNLSTQNGTVLVMDAFNSDFTALKVGDSVRIGFIYLGVSDMSGITTGIYLETLERQTNTSNTPDRFPNESPSIPDNASSDNQHQNNTSTVYVSKRSNTIHSVSDCGGMKNYRVMSREEAETAGYSYCPNCW